MKADDIYKSIKVQQREPEAMGMVPMINPDDEEEESEQNYYQGNNNNNNNMNNGDDEDEDDFDVLSGMN